MLRIHAQIMAKTVRHAPAHSSPRSHARNELRSRTLAGIKTILLAKQLPIGFRCQFTELATDTRGEHVGMPGAFRRDSALTGARRTKEAVECV